MRPMRSTRPSGGPIAVMAAGIAQAAVAAEPLSDLDKQDEALVNARCVAGSVACLDGEPLSEIIVQPRWFPTIGL